MERFAALAQAVGQSLSRAGLVEVEVSARHVHLTQAHFEILFGKGSAMTPKRPLSQPGQYLAEERVTVVGSKGKLSRTAVLGPVRKESQVELSKSDCVALGITAPLRMSGDIDHSGAVTLEGPCGTIALKQGAIIAKEHIHMTPEAAQKLNLSDGEQVQVQVFTERPVTFENVIVRISSQFSCRMHIDFDQANAGLVSGFTLGKIIKQSFSDKGWLPR